MQTSSLANHWPMASVDDEAALALAAARRDAAAFSELYSRYVTRVYRYLYSYVGDRSDAEDLTAQAFSAAWESIHRYREQGNFTAWLFRIVRNKASDYYRRQRPQVSLEACGDLAVNWDPLDSLEQREVLQRLSELVCRLEPEQIELLRLRFAAGLTYAEIAGVQGRSEAAVKMAIHRLLHRLQVAWEKQDGRST